MHESSLDAPSGMLLDAGASIKQLARFNQLLAQHGWHESGSSRWDEDLLSSNIAEEAAKGVLSILLNAEPPADAFEELDGGILVSQDFAIFRGVRFTVLAATTRNFDRKTLLKELFNKERESLCLCILPDPKQELWPLSGDDAQKGAAHVLPVYPDDVVGLSRGILIEDLLEYKLYRRLMLGAKDTETRMVESLFEQFMSARTRNGDFTVDSFQELLDRLPIKESEWVEHPQLARLLRFLEGKRDCLLVGASSSGKTVLAAQIGHALSRMGTEVGYINAGQPSGFHGGVVGQMLFSPECFPPVVVFDDLQSNPDFSHLVLAIHAAARAAGTGSVPEIVAISWPDFAEEVATWHGDLVGVHVRADQLSSRIAAQAGRLGDDIRERLIRRFGSDLLLLRLSLKLSELLGREASYSDLAARIWQDRLPEAIQEDHVKRLLVVVCALGRYDIPTPLVFAEKQADVSADIVEACFSTGLLRKLGDSVSAGHRSLATLLGDWLISINATALLGVEEGDPSQLVLLFLKSLGSGLAVDVLRGLQAKAGFKDEPQLSRSGAALLQVWAAFNALVEQVELQQKKDATWGRVTSSAMFACQIFDTLGKTVDADGSLRFLRSLWTIKSGKLVISTDGLATVEDFTSIHDCMKEEDEQSQTALPPGFEPADKIDSERFHRTWIMGLILCAEAVVARAHPKLSQLIQLVEEEILPSGAFYPQRSPWSTARVLMGLGACGRTISNSEAVRNAARWLLRAQEAGGAMSDGIWKNGTGTWNWPLNVTGIVILGLAAVGFDFDHMDVRVAVSYLRSEIPRFGPGSGKELDAAQAVHAYLEAGGSWIDVSHDARQLADWARSAAFWKNATVSAAYSRDESSRVSQVAWDLISTCWGAIRSNLPAFLDCLAAANFMADQTLEIKAPVDEKETSSRPLAHGQHADLADYVSRLPSIKLSDNRVVGQYFRGDPRIRGRMVKWCDRIRAPLLADTTERENFLVWAKPGSGKTYLVEQLHEELAADIDFIHVDLAKQRRGEIEKRFEAVRSGARPTLCLVDEVDAHTDGGWAYVNLFPLLDLNLDIARRVVFVLIGSSSSGLNGLQSEIASREKGKDLVDRIPNDRRLEIPGLTDEDRVVIVAAQILREARAAGKDICEAELLALYYAASSTDYESPRQLRELVSGAISRIPANYTRLLFEDMFSRGNKRIHAFWHANPEATSELTDVFVRIEEG